MRQVVEAEGEALEEADRFFDRLGRLGEEARHLARAFQMPLGVGLRQLSGGFERHALADAGDDVGERAPLGRVHEGVVGRDEGRAERLRQAHALGERPAHVFAVSQARADPEASAEGVAEAVQRFGFRSAPRAGSPSPLRERDGVRGRAVLGKLALTALPLRGPRDPPP